VLAEIGRIRKRKEIYSLFLGGEDSPPEAPSTFREERPLQKITDSAEGARAVRS
jgi:hypothetical protein